MTIMQMVRNFKLFMKIRLLNEKKIQKGIFLIDFIARYKDFIITLKCLPLYREDKMDKRNRLIAGKSRLKMKKKRLENDETNGGEESGEDWQGMEEMGMESGSEGEQGEEEADIDEAGNDDEFISGKQYKTNIQK